jgi:hypothetical protein
MKARYLLAAVLMASLARPARAQAPPLATPTREHQEMAREEGVWDADCTTWMTPDAEPMKSTGVETNKMFGKLWLVSEFEGEFGGEKFVGKMQLGYDPVKKKYVGTWIDTMGPFLYTMEGDYDVANHTLTMMMSGVDTMTGKPTQWKSVTRYEDEDTKTVEMHQAVEGQPDKWFKSMEIKYKRRK